MRRVLVAVFAMLLSLALIGPMQSATADTIHDDRVFYEVVVELDRDQEPIGYASVLSANLGIPAAETRARVNHIYTTAINGFSIWLTEDEYLKAERLQLIGLQAVARGGDISMQALTNEGGQMEVSHVDADKQILPTGILRIDARTDGDYSGVDVAVIDTGVDKYHPDLNVVGGIDCTTSSGPGSSSSGDYGHDGYGHGTHVAGTIAAKDNDLGVVGVAPGARIWSVKVLDDSGSGSYASVICGIDWVAQHTGDIEVANMSLGGPSFGLSACDGSHEDPMHDAICVAAERTIFVVAAGNSSQDSESHAPATYAEVITVSAFADFDGQEGSAAVAPQNRCYAMSVDDELAAYSNFGEDVDIAAPGTCILSTLPGDVDLSTGMYKPEYGYASGTSMAAPHVAGVIARFLAVNPDQRALARQQMLTWSKANTDPVKGDHDSIHEPLLYVGTGVPRYEGGSEPGDITIQPVATEAA